MKSDEIIQKEEKMPDANREINNKLIASNRKAKFEYFLSDYLEVGLELKGTEIKSLRQGKCSLSDSYIIIKNTTSAWATEAPFPT